MLQQRVCNVQGLGWEAGNHWSLREHAARVAAQVCKQFPSEVYGIQKRITKTFVKTLCDPTKPIVTQYGAHLRPCKAVCLCSSLQGRAMPCCFAFWLLDSKAKPNMASYA